MSDLLELDTVVISEQSLQRKSTTYQVIVQNVVISSLLDMGENISNFFRKVLQVIDTNTPITKCLYT